MDCLLLLPLAVYIFKSACLRLPLIAEPIDLFGSVTVMFILNKIFINTAY